MNWRVVVRPEVECDIAKAVAWYEVREEGLGTIFREEVIQVFDGLAENPLIYCERHPRKDVRWRYPERFPYRVIYEVLETEGIVVVAAVVHAARHDRHWLKRV